VEVSNTPWLEKHYYLVDLASGRESCTEKKFHVSPFMDLAMHYRWRFQPPAAAKNKLMIHIENWRTSTEPMPSQRLFDATLAMRKSPITGVGLLKLWLSMPVMSLKVVMAIYWQALKLWLKGIPFVPYQKSDPP